MNLKSSQIYNLWPREIKYQIKPKVINWLIWTIWGGKDQLSSKRLKFLLILLEKKGHAYCLQSKIVDGGPKSQHNLIIYVWVSVGTDTQYIQWERVPLEQESMCKPWVANMAAAKDHLVPPSSCMNLCWLSHEWFNFMQFVNVFIPLMLSFGFDVHGY